MATDNRPLSPHIQIYRPQFTSVLSILHRITGIGLAAGTLLLVWWLIAAAAGPTEFDTVQNFIGSVVGRILLLAWSFALYYHLCNGIRHLVWDAGKGFELRTAFASGCLVVVAATVLTIISWVAGYASLGGL
ncbi:MAG: succinate dehydrogenase, cytochrome b556 subunit [Proteobacteria bacterium]|nr:succinate dehydrogenase, cytochrome b556 subunit [Pseudomonadota bacterium]